MLQGLTRTNESEELVNLEREALVVVLVESVAKKGFVVEAIGSSRFELWMCEVVDEFDKKGKVGINKLVSEVNFGVGKIVF